MSKIKDTKVPNVHLSDLKRIVSKIEQSVQLDPEITFEFIIASLFPTSWNNIQDALSSQYIEGYRQGYQDRTDETVQCNKRAIESDCYCE